MLRVGNVLNINVLEAYMRAMKENFYLRYGNYQRALLAYVGVSQNSDSSYPTKVLRLRVRLKKLNQKS